ncbi:hypothetical protein GSI_15508 [Ganoderma sinense ZZ0214-1]|uniref:Uncharacterized protein n=1 Tax=Ganoderma sinense ZZ0214-1 TaxID=1077348 RepID=A0A2G8RMS6_9APHY|nr:hypothetical protein GSI_15508 [Ganoderma sinense ZZ0214-1]
MGPFAAGSLPVAAGCSGSPSSLVRLLLRGRASPTRPTDGEGKAEGCMQPRGGGSCRAVREAGRVRTEAARTHSKTQTARPSVEFVQHATVTPGLAACSTGGFPACRRLRELSVPSGLLQRPFLAVASASASCVASRVFLLRFDGT